MLKSLHVENFALIDKIDIQFQPGLNIITGETGAGKSILIDALGATIGEKIESESLRKGTTRAVAEGIFQVASNRELKQFLQQADVEDLADEIILRKEISDSLRNRAFVNDSPVPNSVLIGIGNLLVDLHGQHEHQSLLRVNYHLQYLDEFGGYDQLLADTDQHYHQFMKLNEELQAILARERSLTEKRDLFRFQIQEIQSVDPHPGEEDELLTEEKILLNSEKLYQFTNALFNDLYSNSDSVYDRIADALKKLAELAEIDPKFHQLLTDCQQAQVAIEELAKFLQDYSHNIEFNPERLESVRQRLGQFSLLKRKYQRTVDEIIAYKKVLEQELQDINDLDTVIAAKQKAIEDERQTLSQLCRLLSQQRSTAAKKLEQLVLQHLGELGMKNARFMIKLEQVPDENGAVQLGEQRFRVTAQGIDQVEFYIAANPGEDLKPLVRVASGGEISRIMLALKSSLAQVDRIPVLIFDEIDRGISGRIAQAVGWSLKRLARTHQIICITHLPQIASMGDHHFVVEKIQNKDSTRTQIRQLTADERPVEIAKLLGGESVTETHIQAARELIAEAQKFTATN